MLKLAEAAGLRDKHLTAGITGCFHIHPLREPMHILVEAGASSMLTTMMSQVILVVCSGKSVEPSCADSYQRIHDSRHAEANRMLKNAVRGV